MAQNSFNNSMPGWSVQTNAVSASTIDDNNIKLPKENEKRNVVLLPGQQANHVKESLLQMAVAGIMVG
jgi:hypothetical protein